MPCTNLTYILSGQGGLYHGKLIDILENKGFKQVPIGTPLVNFAWGELDYIDRPKTYEKAFKTQSANLKSVLGGNITLITDKITLYDTIRDRYPEYLNHLPRSRLIKDVRVVKPDEILIARPKGGYARRGIEIITSTQELDNFRRKYGNDAVLSDYILNPMLLKGQKFHLRVHFLVYVNNGYSRGYMLNRIQILTAGDLYKFGEWNNKRIHLTGSEYTDEFYLWPSSFVELISPELLATANTSLQHLITGVITAVGQNSASYPESDSAFEVLGADVMLQDNGHAILIEVNNKVGYKPLPFELQNNIHTLFSSEYFEWVSNSVILPHFGMQSIPTPLWAGNSLTHGSLSNYIEILASPNLLSLLPFNLIPNNYIPNLSIIDPNVDFVTISLKSHEYSVNPCKSFYYWAIILRSHIVGYIFLTPSPNYPYLQLQWRVHPSIPLPTLAPAALSLCLEIIKSISFPSIFRILSYIPIHDLSSLQILHSLNFKELINGTSIFFYDIVSSVVYNNPVPLTPIISTSLPITTTTGTFRTPPIPLTTTTATAATLRTPTIPIATTTTGTVRTPIIPITTTTTTAATLRTPTIPITTTTTGTVIAPTIPITTTTTATVRTPIIPITTTTTAVTLRTPTIPITTVAGTVIAPTIPITTTTTGTVRAPTVPITTGNIRAPTIPITTTTTTTTTTIGTVRAPTVPIITGTTGNVRAPTIPITTTTTGTVRAPTVPITTGNVRAPTVAITNDTGNVRAPTIPITTTTTGNVRAPTVPITTGTVRAPTIPIITDTVRAPNIPITTGPVRAPTIPIITGSVRTPTTIDNLPTGPMTTTTGDVRSPVIGTTNDRTLASVVKITKTGTTPIRLKEGQRHPIQTETEWNIKQEQQITEKRGTNIWRTEDVDIDIPILPDEIILTRDGYNHFICICSPDDVNSIIEKYGDDVKLLVLAKEYNWELEYKAIVCYSKEHVYDYINETAEEIKKRYTFLGSRGLRKYWLHRKLRSWSFVREQKDVDYYRFEYTGIKELDNKSYDVRTVLKTPIDTRSLRNVSKDKIANIGYFVPRTYNMNRFRPRRDHVYILKPVASSGGEGITVFSNDYEYGLAVKKIGNRHGIVSEYINNPKLFNGKKFHLRCYFMVTTWGKFYLYPIFKIITAKLPYYNGDYLNSDIHDTHIKTTPRNLFYPNDMPGTNYFPQIQHICDILSKNIHPYGYEEAENSYEILGLDILIDNNNKAWLLEVNTTPGMHPVNNNYNDYGSFEKGILEWEFEHAISPFLEIAVRVPEGYLFSGNSGFITNYLKQFLTNYGINPAGTGILERNTPRNKIPKYVKFLYVEPLSHTEGFDGRTYTIKTDIHNILETDSKRNLVSKSYQHQLMKGSKFIAKTENLFDFNYTGGVYIIRPCGMIFCSGKDITIISTKQEFDTALIYYYNLVREASLNPIKSLRDIRVIISEYFDDPLLFNGFKFHLRLYLLVVAPISTVPFKCKIARNIGKILTASKPYIKSDFFNKEIHDTHVESTPRSIFFPDEFPQQNLLPHINIQLNKLELELAEICKTVKPFPNQARSAYEIFGLDILVLRNGQIKLLEVNDRVGYNDRDYTLQSVQNFMYLHSLWQWNEAIYPLLQVTPS